LPIDPNDDVRLFIAKEGDDDGFEYIPPGEEQMKKVLEL